MGLLEPYVLNLKKIKSEIPAIAAKIVENNAFLIIEIIQRKQLGIGLNSDGGSLAWEHGTGYYNGSTQDFADHDKIISPKRAGDPYNFSWSQDTFRTMVLEVRDEESFEIFTKDGKQTLLESIYGKIFDLTDKHNEYVNETIIMPELYRYILNNMLQI